jgi:NAD(P)-dependent dehydrogenase (short-subunit alcohol dehydrogenase family)
MNSKKLAVVTGGNRGIGFEVCKQLASSGLKVLLTARDRSKGKAACDELHKQGLDVVFHQLDPTDATSIKNFAKFLEKEFGRLDVLINNAGILIPNDDVASQTDIDILRQTLETNVVSVLAMSQAMIPLMKKHGGKIINVSSDLSSLHNMDTGYVAYRISKTGLNAITRVLAAELAGSKIKVNSMTPGWVRTDMGGEAAPRSVEEGADTIVWLATLPEDGPTGGFFRDRTPHPW